MVGDRGRSDAAMRKVLFLLGQLSDEDVEWVGRVGERRRLKPGDVLIREGHQVDWLYVILDGRVAVTVEGIGEVASLSIGEVFGEMSFVDAMPPSATVTASTLGRVLAVDKRALARRLAEEPFFAGRFYRSLAILLSDRLRAATRLKAAVPGTISLDGDEALDRELDGNVLDTLSQAGARFDRLMKMLNAPAG
jgi:CRP-like cAMP-binding protein